MSSKHEGIARLLAAGALMARTTWEAIVALRGDPNAAAAAQFAKLQRALEAGEGQLGIFILHDGQSVHLSAGALPLGKQDPFGGERLMHASAPLSEIVLEMQRLFPVPEQPHGERMVH